MRILPVPASPTAERWRGNSGSATIDGDIDTRGVTGSVARITQISARSEQGFDDAARVGIERANATLRHVTGAWVKDQKVEIENGQVTAFQVILEITFILD
ncbi:MAG TPA: dodecin family protein [Jiangellaceae bacterium]|nr:dodecin family protein [Jiangellaceae bacterium]